MIPSLYVEHFRKKKKKTRWVDGWMLTKEKGKYIYLCSTEYGK